MERLKVETQLYNDRFASAVIWHNVYTHEGFLERAQTLGRSQMFIRNVCNHLGCKE